MSAILDSFDDISKAAPEPIYLQIKKTIQQRIESGEWPAGLVVPEDHVSFVVGEGHAEGDAWIW